MKNIFAMAMAAAMMCGCEKAIVPEEGSVCVVNFNLDAAAWNVTRGLSADGHDMTDLWLFDYVDGELERTVHMTSADGDLSEPTLSLSYGLHRVYIVASRGRGPSIDGTEITWTVPSDTFWASVYVSVVNGMSRNIPVTLSRVATRLTVTVTDALPTGLSTLEVVPSEWWYGFDYLSGAAVNSSSEARTVSIPAGYEGREDVSFHFYGLSDDGTWESGIAITGRDSEGNSIGSVELSAVEFARNTTTTATGSLFSSTTVFTVSVDGDWDEGRSVIW